MKGHGTIRPNFGPIISPHIKIHKRFILSRSKHPKVITKYRSKRILVKDIAYLRLLCPRNGVQPWFSQKWLKLTSKLLHFFNFWKPPAPCPAVLIFYFENSCWKKYKSSEIFVGHVAGGIRIRQNNAQI